MATTRLALQTSIYEILQKTATAYGLLTPAKVNSAIQDALDFISSMMNTRSSAWLAKEIYLDIIGSSSVYSSTAGDAAFVAATKTITLTAGTWPTWIRTAGRQFIIAGTTSNNGTFTVVSVTGASKILTVLETLVNETPAGVSTFTSNTRVVLPSDCFLINFVKKQQFGTQYCPISYDESCNTTTDTESQNTANYTPTWKLLSGIMVLEPSPADTLTNGILLNYIAFPTALSADTSTVNVAMDFPVFMQFAKWRAASILWSTTHDQAQTPPWADTEVMWLSEVRKAIPKRVVKPAIIMGMTDY